jgi:hypothetical protein
MKTLELKHLAPYLPYDLQLIDKEGNIRYLRAKAEGFEDISIDYVEYWKAKPILRPLSDLIKQLEYRGKLHTYSEILEKINLEEVGGYAMIDFSYWLSLANTKILSGGCPYWMMEKFFEWHFDVFGLIPAGLAIDINTIK